MSIHSFDVNGIRLEVIKNSSSIAFFGIGVMAGSNCESQKEAGISHFAEHMFFKGTQKRNWKEINKDIAMLGADNNAFTNSSHVMHYITCPSDNIGKSIELMMDLFFNSIFPEDEIEKERNVILEEMKMYENDPISAFSWASKEALFVWDKGHRSIGTTDTVNKFKKEDIVRFLGDKYGRDNLIFMCCGNVDENTIKKCVEDNIPKNHTYFRNDGTNDVGLDLWSDLAKCSADIKFVMEKEGITQSIASCYFAGISAFDTCYFASLLAQKVLGGGTYSRLWERIREELGLCYSMSISTLTLGYPYRTAIELFGLVSPENISQFMEESEKIIRYSIQNGVDKDVFECAKIDMISSILRATETSMGEASYLLRDHLFGKNNSVLGDVEIIKNIKIETCNELIQKLFDVDPIWALLKPKGD